MPDDITPAENQSGDGDWTPPATQADLNRIIAERVSRERAKFADYSEIKAKAEQFDSAQEAAKTELQKALERAEAAEKRVQSFESERQIADWKRGVSEETGVPVAALSGSTRDDIAAHAAVLAPLIKASPKGPRVPNVGDTPSNTSGEDLETIRSLFGKS